MHLTTILFTRGRFHFVKRIPGNIWIGKHRYVPPVTRNKKLQLWKDLAVEEETMMYLKHPYLTEAQEWNHAKALGKDAARKAEIMKKHRKKLEHTTMEEHLLRFNISRAWE